MGVVSILTGERPTISARLKILCAFGKFGRGHRKPPISFFGSGHHMVMA